MRIALVPLVIFFVSLNAMAAENLTVQVNPSATQVTEGESVTFTVSVKNSKNGKPANLAGRRVDATFPTSQDAVTLTGSGSSTYSYTAATHGTGTQTLTATVRLNTPQLEAALLQAITETRNRISALTAELAQTSQFLRRLLLQVEIAVNNALLQTLEQQLVALRTPLAEGSASITVVPRPQGVTLRLTAPAANAFVTGTVTLSVESNAAVPGSAAIVVDGTAGAFQQVPAGNFTLPWDSATAAEGAHQIVVQFKPDGQAQTYATPSLSLRADHLAPTVSNLLPEDGSAGDQARPGISGQLADAGSGVDPISVTLFVDDQQVDVSVVGDGFLYTPAADLAVGSHAVRLEVRDLVGNLKAVTWSFRVTGDQPAFENFMPADGKWVKEKRPILFTHVVGNGIDPESMSLSISKLTDAGRVALAGVSPIYYNGGITAEVPYDLEEREYEVTAEISNLAGQAGSATWRFKTDYVPPAVTGLAAAWTTDDFFPEILADLSDARSGVNVASVRFELDGTDLTASAEISADRVRYQPVEPLSAGTHALAVRVADLAGNTTVFESFLTVKDPDADQTAPLLALVAPAPGQYVSTLIPRVAYVDVQFVDVSGVDLSSVVLKIDGAAVALPEGSLTAAGLRYPLPALFPEGRHAFYVAASDLAGNGPAELTGTFGVDNTPPEIVVSDPEAGLTGGAGLRSVFAALFDTGDGEVDWTTLHAGVNGTDFSAEALAGRDGDLVRFSIAEPFYGDRTLVLRVTDKAGNETQKSVTQTPALFGFIFWDWTTSMWVEADPRFMVIPDTPGLPAWFYAHYADGVDPATFTGNFPGFVVDAYQDGWIRFYIDNPGFGYAVSGSFQIQDNAHRRTYDFPSFIGVVSEFNDPPTVFLNPQGEGTGDIQISPKDVISFTAYASGGDAGSYIASIKMYVNGVQIQPELFGEPGQTVQFPRGFVSGQYAPQPFITAPVLDVVVRATNLLGQETVAQQRYRVVDDTAPTIEIYNPWQPGVAVGGTPLAVSFNVSDNFNGYGVDTAHIRVTYTIDGVPGEGLAQAIVEPINPTLARCTFEFPAGIPLGKQVFFTIHARDLNPAGGAEATASSSFVADQAGPLFSNIVPAPNSTVPAEGAVIRFDVSDAPAGLLMASANLFEVSPAGDSFVGSVATFNAGTFQITPNQPLLAGKQYRIDFEGTDTVQNVSNHSVSFSTQRAPDTTAPSISINPAHGTTSNTFVASVVVTDAGGLAPSNVSVAFDGVPLAPTSTLSEQNGTKATVNLQYPVGTPNGPHVLTVHAVDLDGNAADASSSFMLDVTLPPTPVLTKTVAGDYIITLSGPVPPSPSNLNRLDVSVSGASVGIRTFDRARLRWQVQLVRNSGANATCDLRFGDSLGRVSAVPLHLNLTFPTSGVRPPLNLPAPPPPPDKPLPPGAVPPDPDPLYLSVYWDFHPEDITGVSRNWIPCTNKAAVRIVGWVLGGMGSYTIRVQGGLTGDFPNQNKPRFECLIPLPDEGLKSDIVLEIEDESGTIIYSRARKLWVDRTPPEAVSSIVTGIDMYTREDVFGLTDTVNPEGSGIAAVFSNTSMLSPQRLWGSGFDYLSPNYKSIRYGPIPCILPDGSFGEPQHGMIYTKSQAEYSVPFILRDGGGNDRHVSSSVGIRGLSLGEYYETDVFARFVYSVRQRYSFVDTPTFISGEPSINPYAGGGGNTLPEEPEEPPMELFHSINLFGMNITQDQLGVVRVKKPGVYWTRLTQRDERSVGPPLESIEMRAFRFFEPQLLVDENNNGVTSDENQDRQVMNGAVVPMNDSFDALKKDETYWKPDYEIENAEEKPDPTLRLVTFDEKLAEPKYREASEDPNFRNTPVWNGSIWSVTIRHSLNTRLWRTAVKSAKSRINSVEELEGVGNELANMKEWDLTNQTQYLDFQSIKGKLFVECLPVSGVATGEAIGQPCWIELTVNRIDNGSAQAHLTYETYRIRVYLHPVSDKNEGYKAGEPTVSVGGGASVDLTSGALKAAWPLAQSGSSIIPDLQIFYNSRDLLTDEAVSPRFINPRSYVPRLDSKFVPKYSVLGKGFRHSLEMCVVRGDRKIELIDMDGRRVEFEPDVASLPADESSVTWIPQDRKGDFSKIKLVKQTRFGQEREYYLLLRPAENRQYLFDKRIGRLLEIRDAYDNCATLQYEEYGGTGGALQGISDNRGHFLYFSGSGGAFSVVDSLGRYAEFTSKGIDGPLGKHAFETDGKGMLKRFSNIRGAEYEVTDARYGVVYKIKRLEDGREMSFEHKFDTLETIVHQYAKDGDPDRAYTYTYHPYFNLWTSMSFTTKAPSSVTLTQNPSKFGQVKSSTNLYGKATTFEYDAATGLPVSYTDADKKTPSVTVYTAKPNARFKPAGPNYLSQITLVESVSDGNGHATRTEYNGDGFVESVTHSKGTVTYSLWNEFGQPRRSVGPRADFSQDIAYDLHGFVAAVTDRGMGKEFSVVYHNDALGRVKRAIQSDGRMMSYYHDAQGRLIGSGGPHRVNLNTLAIEADGGTDLSSFDAGGSWLYSMDRSGRTASQSVGRLGQVLSSTAPDGSITRYEDFDALFMPAKVIMPPIEGGMPARQASLKYDLIGRTVEAKAPDGLEYITTYDDAARTVATLSPKGLVTVRTLTGAGRVSVTSTPNGANPTFDYDGNGWRNKLRVQGRAMIATRYNQMGQTMEQSVEGTALKTSHEFDVGFSPIQTTLPGGIVIDHPVDGLGRPTFTKIAGTNISRNLYGGAPAVAAANTLTPLPDPNPAPNPNPNPVPGPGPDPDPVPTLQNPTENPYLPVGIQDMETSLIVHLDERNLNDQVTKWRTSEFSKEGATGSVVITGQSSFLKSGELSSVTDPLNKMSHVAWDGAGRNTGATDQDSLGSSRAFTSGGFLKSTTDDRGKTTHYFYEDLSGRLKAERMPDGKGIVYRYDSEGFLQFKIHVNHVPMDGNVSAAEAGAGLKYEYLYKLGTGQVESVKDPLGHLTRYTYYADGNVETVTDPDGRVVKKVFDKAGRLEETRVTPGNLVTKYKYHPNGQVESVTYPDKRTATYQYDERGRVEMVTTSGEGRIKYEYAKGDLFRVTDAEEKATVYLYDDAHRLYQTVYPDNKTVKLDLDVAGRAASVTDRKSQVFHYTYHDNGRRWKVFHAGVQLHEFTYQGNTPTNDGGTSWSLDDAGRVEALTGAGGVNVAYAYEHPLGLMTSKSYNGVDLTYEYDAAARLRKVKDNDGNSLTYDQRTAGGLPEKAHYSNGIAIDWKYDGNWNPERFSYTRGGQTLHACETMYNNLGKCKSMTLQPSGETYAYQYYESTDWRLRSETRTLNGVSTKTDYTYSLMGDRKTRTSLGRQETYVYNDLHQLKKITYGDGRATNYAYDDNGNLEKESTVSEPQTAVAALGAAPVAEPLKKSILAAGPGGPKVGDEQSYVWDQLNRLRYVEKKDSTGILATATFEYPAYGWQATSQTVNVTAGNTTETRSFGYGMGGELLTESVPNAGTRTYVNGGLDRVMWSKDAQGTNFWLTGGSGSVYAITDAAGNVMERQRFDAFGKTERTDASGQPLPQSALGNRLGFNGRMNLEEFGLQYLRNRFYSPTTGRFISADPIGYEGGLNLYNYCGGDPVNHVDPMGTVWVWNDAIDDWEWVQIGNETKTEKPENIWNFARQEGWVDKNYAAIEAAAQKLLVLSSQEFFRPTDLNNKTLYRDQRWQKKAKRYIDAQRSYFIELNKVKKLEEFQDMQSQLDRLYYAVDDAWYTLELLKKRQYELENDKIDWGDVAVDTFTPINDIKTARNYAKGGGIAAGIIGYSAIMFYTLNTAWNVYTGPLKGGTQKVVKFITKEGEELVIKKAPAILLANLLREFESVSFSFGEHILRLDKSGMKHILERHHPKYWDGTLKLVQSWMDKNTSVEEVVDIIESVLKQNRETILKKGTRGIYAVEGEVNGVKYIIGLNNGRVGQFYAR
ncbi:MAG: hypothetical protein KIS92_02145 [Planctomycetota bacterium]|nr:hypothetical protein [Planctomycetota bacterium]